MKVAYKAVFFSENKKKTISGTVNCMPKTFFAKVVIDLKRKNIEENQIQNIVRK